MGAFVYCKNVNCTQYMEELCGFTNQLSTHELQLVHIFLTLHVLVQCMYTKVIPVQNDMKTLNILESLLEYDRSYKAWLHL